MRFESLRFSYERVAPMSATRFIVLSMALLVTSLPALAHASPARRLARQGVVVVPVPTATPAPAVVMPLPGALPVVTSRPLRPWRKSLVQPVAVLVPVPGVPLVAAPTLEAPASPAPIVVPAPEEAAPAAVAPQPTTSVPQAAPQQPRSVLAPAPGVEQIPAPLPGPAGGEPELRFGTP